MPFETELASELAQLSERLTAAAARAVESATADAAGRCSVLTVERDALRARIQELTTGRDALAQQVTDLSRQLTGFTSQIAALTAQVADLESARSTLNARSDELVATNASLVLELAERASERETTDAAAQEALAAERERVAVLQREHAEAFERLALVERAAQSSDATAAATEAALRAAEEAQAREAAARRDLEQEAARLREESSAGRRGHRDELADHLAAVFDDIARSASVDEVLGAAANGLTNDFSRVVVLAVRNDRLEPRYQCGFEPGSGVEQTSLPIGGGSMLARAAGENELGLYSGDESERPFGGTASLSVTAPIVVRGEPLALIYADNDGHDDSVLAGSTPVRMADMLRQYASLRLDRLTLELKALDELRAYAKMLLDEVEYVYRADVSARKPEGERLERLRENLRCARQIYQQRVVTEGPAMASLLEDVVSATMAARAASPFGRELAAVSAHAVPDTVEA